MRQVIQQNPWESSFENLTASAGKPIKKAVTEAVKITAEDVREQLFGAKPPQEMPTEEQQKLEAQEQVNLAETSRRMKEMEEAVQRIKEQRLKKESSQVERAKQEKKAVEQKKRQEVPIWQKAMNMGSQSEKRVNAGG
ncbi:MAG: hypothetical protein G01um101416_652 [Microgenomates group bacterium Gr01-1014_16]|nr:MAG: hypothetical protein G01um101416_652 [Microgenomates group bacterium Gr01-1014_16]